MDLHILDGKTTVIVGESGSGKSVTILAILGLLPMEAHVSGSIELDGTQLLGLSEKEMNGLRGKELGYIPQGGGNSMHPLIPVGEQIAEPVRVHQKSSKIKALEKAIEWMDMVGLRPAKKLAGDYPHTLSGGMKQRALIAMGAIGGAKVLLADEPTKGLDEKRITHIEELFKSLTDKTILCVTHDLRFARKIADYVCVMYDGRVVEYVDSVTFFASPKHPYSQMLIASLPENGLNCPDSFTPSVVDRSGCSFYHRCPHQDADCRREIHMYSVGNHQVRCRLHAARD